MFHIATDTFISAQVGQVQRDVCCERCGCDYSYQMVRRGKGQSMTLHGIATENALKQAAKSASAKLTKMLMRHHDPVACPGCGWIQLCMINSMRARAHRWLTKTGWV